jgi:hypothetical protein
LIVINNFRHDSLELSLFLPALPLDLLVTLAYPG